MALKGGGELRCMWARAVVKRKEIMARLECILRETRALGFRVERLWDGLKRGSRTSCREGKENFYQRRACRRGCKKEI